MKPVVTNVIAGLLGMTLGWVVMGDPLSAMFAPTQVTWNAASCPPGVYTVTSLARSMSTSASHTVSTTNVTLPRDSVVQQFPNLPAGQYSVRASAKRADGLEYGSEAQTLTGLGDPAGVAGLAGRSRPAGSAPLSRAVPRRSGGPAAATPPSVLSRVTGSGPTPNRRAIPSAKLAAQKSAAPVNLASPLFRITFDAAGNLLSTDAAWQRIELTDLDTDGRFDLATIELVTGDVWIIHLKR